jgi:hypothetical protein
MLLWHVARWPYGYSDRYYNHAVNPNIFCSGGEKKNIAFGKAIMKHDILMIIIIIIINEPKVISRRPWTRHEFNVPKMRTNRNSAGVRAPRYSL